MKLHRDQGGEPMQVGKNYGSSRLAMHWGRALAQRAQQLGLGSAEAFESATGVNVSLRDHLFRQPDQPVKLPGALIDELARALDLDKAAAAAGELKIPTEAIKREDYAALLLRFRYFLSDRGEDFQVGMRRAIYAAMGEGPNEPPAKRLRGEDQRPAKRRLGNVVESGIA